MATLSTVYGSVIMRITKVMSQMQLKVPRLVQ